MGLRGVYDDEDDFQFDDTPPPMGNFILTTSIYVSRSLDFGLCLTCY